MMEIATYHKMMEIATLLMETDHSSKESHQIKEPAIEIDAKQFLGSSINYISFHRPISEARSSMDLLSFR